MTGNGKGSTALKECIVGLPLTDLVVTILREGKKQGYYVKSSRNYLILRKSAFVFNVLPVDFQVSFIAKLFAKENNTLITGKFDVPPLFYKLYISLFLVCTSVSLMISFSTTKSVSQILPIMIILVSASFLIVKLYVLISRIIFVRHNEMVLLFLEFLAKTYPKKD